MINEMNEIFFKFGKKINKFTFSHKITIKKHKIFKLKRRIDSHNKTSLQKQTLKNENEFEKRRSFL